MMRYGQIKVKISLDDEPIIKEITNKPEGLDRIFRTVRLKLWGKK